MTDTFNPAPGFFSYVTPLTYLNNGPTNETMMIGEDGNHYSATCELFSETIRVRVMCMETGATIGKTLTQYQTDLSSRGVTDLPTPTNIIAAQGTKYFWALGTVGAQILSAVMYKIVNQTTITVVGSLWLKATSVSLHVPGDLFGSTVINGNVYTISNTSVVGVAQHNLEIFKLPLVEQDLGTGLTGSLDPLMTPMYQCGNNIFYWHGNEGASNIATIVPTGEDAYGVLINVNYAGYLYIQANPGSNALLDTLIRPTMLWLVNGSFTDVTDNFGFTDQGKKLDGVTTGNADDDYQSPNVFTIFGTTYLAWCRSYTDPADLAPVGTKVRTRIGTWDGEAFTQVQDVTQPLFDPVSDVGISSGGRDNTWPASVQLGYDPATQNLYYSWYGAPVGGHPMSSYYVFGIAFHVIHIEAPGFRATISELRDTDYLDWHTVGGADFDAFLDTSFYLSQSNALFMQAPWVVSFLDNTTDFVVDQFGAQVTDELGNPVYVEPSLNLTPKWEWTDSLMNHKSGPTLDVYQLRTKSTVSDRRTRVRGKGRALQLHWSSTDRKTFNLLGWSVQFDQNASY